MTSQELERNALLFSRLFSSTAFRDFATTQRSDMVTQALIDSGIFRCSSSSATLLDAYALAYSVLRKTGNRDDYVFRNTLLTKKSIGFHSVRKSAKLSEYRVGASKVDIAMINREHMTAYEIKSDRDSLTKLPSQVSDYYQVFPSVYVVTSETKVAGVLKRVPQQTGILVLTKQLTLQVVRKATEHFDDISIEAMADSLRMNELLEGCNRLGVVIDSVPNTVLRTHLTRKLCALPKNTARKTMASVLYERRDEYLPEESYVKLPECLRAGALMYRLQELEVDNILKAMETPLSFHLQRSN